MWSQSIETFRPYENILPKETVVELAANHGALDLLTAYIMRTAGVDEDVAADWAYEIDYSCERWLDEKQEDEDEENDEE